MIKLLLKKELGISKGCHTNYGLKPGGTQNSNSYISLYEEILIFTSLLSSISGK